MSMNVACFSYAERNSMAALIADLIEGRGQFSVSPDPQGLNQLRTGWRVSWPQEAIEQRGPSPQPPEAA